MPGTCFNVLLNRANVCCFKDGTALWRFVNERVSWTSLQQHVADGPAGLVNCTLWMTVFSLKIYSLVIFFTCLFSEVKVRSCWKRWRMILQPVESGKNLVVMAGHFLKSLWEWWITFLSWGVSRSVKASAVLHCQGLKDSLYLHPSSTFTCDPQCTGKHVLEICVSCEGCEEHRVFFLAPLINKGLDKL